MPRRAGSSVAIEAGAAAAPPELRAASDRRSARPLRFKSNQSGLRDAASVTAQRAATWGRGGRTRCHGDANGRGLQRGRPLLGPVGRGSPGRGGAGGDPGPAPRAQEPRSHGGTRARRERRAPRGLAAACGHPRGRAGGAPAWVGPALGLQAGARPCLRGRAEGSMPRAPGAPQGNVKPPLCTPPSHPGAAFQAASPPYARAGTETRCRWSSGTGLQARPGEPLPVRL